MNLPRAPASMAWIISWSLRITPLIFNCLSASSLIFSSPAPRSTETEGSAAGMYKIPAGASGLCSTKAARYTSICMFSP